MEHDIRPEIDVVLVLRILQYACMSPLLPRLDEIIVMLMFGQKNRMKSLRIQLQDFSLFL